MDNETLLLTSEGSEQFPADICSRIERSMATIENKLKDGFLDKDLLLLYKELKEKRDYLINASA